MSRPVSTVLDDDVADRLTAEAARREVTVAYLARRAIERLLPAWEGQALP